MMLMINKISFCFYFSGIFEWLSSSNGSQQTDECGSGRVSVPTQLLQEE